MINLLKINTNMTNITTWTPYFLLELYNTSHGYIYIHIHIYIYQNLFASTEKQGRIHSLHLINHLPCSSIGPKLLSFHFNLLDFSILKHDFFPLQYALRLQMEFSFWFQLQYRTINDMIKLLYISFKQKNMENTMDFHYWR